MDYPCSYGAHQKGLILNISKGGLFIKPEREREQSGIIHISFIYKGQEVNLYGKVIHNFTFEGERGFGVEFHELNDKGSRAIKMIIKDLEANKTKRRPERRPTIKSFMNWMKHLPTGKGIFPEKNYRNPKTQDQDKKAG